MDEDQFKGDASNPQDQENQKSFAELLESYESGMTDDIQVGDKIRGRIISISNNNVFFNTGTKADAVAEKEELLDEEGNLPYELGDELELYVVSADESEIRLSRAISGIGGLNTLKDAYANAIPVEGSVKQSIKGGFQVEVLKRRAFCPISQIDAIYVDKPESYVGGIYQFLIKKFTEGGRNIVLSRRELLEAEQKKNRDAFLQQLEKDQTHKGKVTRLMPFGAFVELIPGLEGMVHISELSWSHVEKPEEVLKPGDEVNVQILRIEPGEKQKIALSIKQVLADPWENVEDKFAPGQKVNGKVTRCAKFGAFVEIDPGVEGLVHLSEMSYTQRIMRAEDIVEPGQAVTVMIKEVDTRKKRVSLSIKDALGDPWLNIEDKYKPNTAVKGSIEKKENFGLFVALEPGVVGLLPKSEINQSGNASKIDKLKPGDFIDVTIKAVNPSERKISLSLGKSSEENNWRKFSTQKSNSALGSLGEKLAQALKNKKK